MKVLLFGALAAAFISTVQARPIDRIDAGAKGILAPLKHAATDCFASTVMANPAAMNHARAGHWYEAASVIGFLCRPEVDAMIRAHDHLYGAGTGTRFFKSVYAQHLDRELSVRLQPLLERKTVASAEPPIDKASDEAAPGR